MARELTAEESSSLLSGFSGFFSVVNKLLADGVTAAEVAETVLSIVSPPLASDVAGVITVLQELEKLIPA